MCRAQSHAVAASSALEMDVVLSMLKLNPPLIQWEKDWLERVRTRERIALIIALAFSDPQ